MHITKLWTQLNRVRGSDDTERAGEKSQRLKYLLAGKLVGLRSCVSNPHPRSI
jgi:hypothetical protein